MVSIVDDGWRSLILVVVSVGLVGRRWRQWLLDVEAKLEGGGHLVGESKMGGNEK